MLHCAGHYHVFADPHFLLSSTSRPLTSKWSAASGRGETRTHTPAHAHTHAHAQQGGKISSATHTLVLGPTWALRSIYHHFHTHLPAPAPSPSSAPPHSHAPLPVFMVPFPPSGSGVVMLHLHVSCLLTCLCSSSHQRPARLHPRLLPPPARRQSLRVRRAESPRLPCSVPVATWT